MGGSAATILVVLNDLPLGGTERIAIRLANRWAALGRRVTVLCGVRDGPLAPMISKAVEVLECDPQIPRGPGAREALGKVTARLVANRRPDILFVPGNYGWRVMPAVTRLPGELQPGLVAQISTPLCRHGRGPLRQLVYDIRTRWLFSRVDAAISLSAAMTSDADRLLGRSITQTIRLPALEDEDAPLTRATGKLIVAAGRLVKEKGFDLAIRAFALMNDPQARLAIVGEGPERGRLAALAASLGVADRVEMPGFTPDIRPWLERSRAFLLTSYYEGYAAVILEALAAGRQVVATNCTPAAYELLAASHAGGVAPIGDAPALAERLTEVLRSPAPSPDSLAVLVDGYRIGPIAQTYLQAFDAVAARRAAAAAQVTPPPAFGAGIATAARRLAKAMWPKPHVAWRQSA